MPKLTIHFLESAVTDLEALKRWYSEQGLPDVGDRFITEIMGRVEVLYDHPDMGRVVPEFDQPFLREIIHPPFRIVSWREPNKVQVIRVWRSERLLRIPAHMEET
ncbi:MAG: addiction module toxin RelE [endosymbiont of Seepiophila jonesi]|uniref:Addiction module toxin RelE n=1 Tax=endosymbiont of Lamellibrachia luymesi TaxID=2200907 RepID=A0A370E354_9GAMM|nr:MAG: addiction module toxin RelE [endosymbiont of Lamellibrachia luymesi]RDH94159.1 MAG: addiction module toxin RelE [endosymbiont of Seepiophila jonesi]